MLVMPRSNNGLNIMAKNFLRKSVVSDELQSKGCGMAEHKELMKALNNNVGNYLDNACAVSLGKPIKKVRITPDLVKNVLPKM